MGGEAWLQFKSPKEARRCEEFLKPLDSHVGIDGKWGCWLTFKGQMRLEVGYQAFLRNAEIAVFVRREVCRRFDVRKIGADFVGWYPNSNWESTDPRGAPARYPGYTDWAVWAKDYKPEWSPRLPKKEFYPGNEAIFEEMLADLLRDLREIEAFVEAKFKELDEQWTP